MYVHSVKLVNYKSFGDYNENEIIIEPNVTAIIGKNESGKSNVLDGLSRLNFKSRTAKAFTPDLANRNGSSEKRIVYHIVIKPQEEDVDFGIVDDTFVEISKDGDVFTGGVLKYYQTVIMPIAKELVASLGGPTANPFRFSGQDLNAYNSYCNILLREDKLSVPQIIRILAFFTNNISRLPIDKQDQIKELIDNFEELWFRVADKLPIFYLRVSDKHLLSSYKYEDINKELKNPNVNPNSLLFNFIKAIGVSNEDFLLAARSGTEARQNTVRSRINRLINSKINVPFTDFYKTEEINLGIDFNGGTISFSVQSNDGESLSISERSNGLRWYLETFIDAQSNNLPGSNVVYLLDEPGASLHVNAQRKLLELFKHLASQGNQVVYTTHSPYMLDTEQDGMHRIRAVVKDEEGYSKIYKTAYDQRIAPESQQDTLAPIITALGMNLNDTFGPAKDKINIVTEGMSDYIFICTMAKFLELNKDKYCIIPSVGAPNCINICTILHGWGCKYIALFDYDKAGVETGGEIMRKKLGFEYKKQYCYLNNISQEQVDGQTYKTEKYMIEDVVSRAEIERFYRESGQTVADKTLTAKLMCNAIENGSFSLSETTVQSFKELFERILAYCS